jgi:hypothetical protein
VGKIDIDKLRNALATYNDAKRKFEAAKCIYENKLDELNILRKEIQAEFNIVRDEFFKAGAVFTKFTDEHPDEDDEEEENEDGNV